MKKYYAKADALIAVVLISTIVIMWLSTILLWNDVNYLASTITSIICLLITLFIGSILVNTYYQLGNDTLYWRTGPFKGTIRISDVTQVRRAKSILEITALIKPSLTTKPLLVKYAKYDELPISPRDEQAFLENLKRLNPSIQIGG